MSDKYFEDEYDEMIDDDLYYDYDDLIDEEQEEGYIKSLVPMKFKKYLVEE